jgi:hypothetical protein
VIAKATGFFRLETLALNVCRITLVGHGDAGGNIGKQAMAWGIKTMLSVVSLLQDKYIRNGAKVDAETRGAFPAPPPRSSLTSEQVRRASEASAKKGGLQRKRASERSKRQRRHHLLLRRKRASERKEGTRFCGGSSLTSASAK